jgi:hypothetical protein
MTEGGILFVRLIYYTFCIFACFNCLFTMMAVDVHRETKIRIYIVGSVELFGFSYSNANVNNFIRQLAQIHSRR